MGFEIPTLTEPEVRLLKKLYQDAVVFTDTAVVYAARTALAPAVCVEAVVYAMPIWSPAKATAHPGNCAPRAVPSTAVRDTERNTLTGLPAAISTARAEDPASTGVAIGIPVEAVKPCSNVADSFTYASAEYNSNGFAKILVVVFVDVTVEDTTEVDTDVAVDTDVDTEVDTTVEVGPVTTWVVPEVTVDVCVITEDTVLLGTAAK